MVGPKVRTFGLNNFRTRPRIENRGDVPHSGQCPASTVMRPGLIANTFAQSHFSSHRVNIRSLFWTRITFDLDLRSKSAEIFRTPRGLGKPFQAVCGLKNKLLHKALQPPIRLVSVYVLLPRALVDAVRQSDSRQNSICEGCIRFAHVFLYCPPCTHHSDTRLMPFAKFHEKRLSPSKIKKLFLALEFTCKSTDDTSLLPH